MLRSMIAVSVWDGVIASIAYLFLLPLFAIVVSPWFLLGYVIDLPAVMVPVLLAAWGRRELMRALSSIPSFLVLRWVNCLFMLEAVWSELVVGKRLTTYEKGH